MPDGADRAIGYIDCIEDCCRSLSMFPDRGNRREDLRLGSRIAALMNVTEMRYDSQFGRALERLLHYRTGREIPANIALENSQKLKFNGTNLGTN